MQNQNSSSNPQSPHGAPRVAPQTNLQQPWRETYAAAPRAQQPYPNAAVTYVHGISLANPVSGLSGSEHLGPVAPQQSYPQPPNRPQNPMPVNPHLPAWCRPRNTPLRQVDGNSKTNPIVLDEDEAPRKGGSTTSPIVLDEEDSPREQLQPTQPKWVNVTERVYRLERAPEEDDIAHWAWHYMSWMWSFGKHFGSNKGSKTHRWYVDPEDHKMLHCIRVCDGVKMRHWELQTKLETLQAELAKEQAHLPPRRLPSSSGPPPSGPSNQKGVRKVQRKEREQEKISEVGRKRKARDEDNEDSAKRVRLQQPDEEAIAEDEVEEDEAAKALVASCEMMMEESGGEEDEVVEEGEDDEALVASCEGMMEESEEDEEDEERDEESE